MDDFTRKNEAFLEHKTDRRHTDPNGRYDQNEIKRNKGLNYFYFSLLVRQGLEKLVDIFKGVFSILDVFALLGSI